MNRRGGDERYNPGTVAALGLTLAFQTIFVATGWLLLWAFRHESLLRGLRPELSLGFILGVGSLAGVVAALMVVSAYRFIPAYARSLDEVMRLFGAFHPRVLLIMALPSAFGEELLFRGSLQTLIGLVLAAAIFGLAHTAGRRGFWSYGVTAGAVGYIFGLAFQFSGELWVPVVAHAVYNLVVIAALFRGFAGVDGGRGIWYNTFCR